MPYAMLAFLSLLWGSSFLLIKIVTRSYDAYSSRWGGSAWRRWRWRSPRS